MSFSKIAAGLATLAVAASPLAALAQGGKPNVNVNASARAGSVGARVDAQFCALLETHVKDVSARFGGFDGKLADVREERDARFRDRKEEVNDKVIDRRAENDEKHVKLVTRLEAAATTDAQKAAVAKFKLALSAAVAARRTASDKANADFRAALDAALMSRRSKSDAALAAFKTAVNAAVAKAKADCAAGKDPSTVRATLRTELAAAHAKLKTDRAAIDKIGADVKKLVEVRRTAVAKAHADFKASMEKARAELKAAFKAEAEVKTE